MNQLTALDVLIIINKRAQWMRSEGESDMRSIIYLVQGLQKDIANGKSREEILQELEELEDEE